MGQWDDLMKLLVGENPQHVVSLLLSGAQFEGVLERELKARTIIADLLCAINWLDTPAVLHLEFQSWADPEMGERRCTYNLVTKFLTKRVVCSFAVYLRKDTGIVEPPYEETLPDGGKGHIFHFRNLKLWELSGEVLEQAGLEGLLPLLPLTKAGPTRETVERMLAALAKAGKQNLYSLAFAISGLVMNGPEDREWLKGQRTVLKDVIEQSWVYQEWMQEAQDKGMQQGMQQGIQQGMQQGRQEGHQEGMQQGVQQGMQQGRQEGLQQGLQSLRQAVLAVVQARFPELATPASRQVASIEDPAFLEHLLVKMSTVQTVQEAALALVSLDR